MCVHVSTMCEHVCVCMCACAQHMCAHVCACVYVCMHVGAHVCVRTSQHMCAHMCMCAHVCVRARVCVHVCTSQCTCARMYMCVHTCVHVPARVCSSPGAWCAPLTSPAPGPRADVIPRLPTLPASLSQIQSFQHLRGEHHRGGSPGNQPPQGPGTSACLGPARPLPSGRLRLWINLDF